MIFFSWIYWIFFATCMIQGNFNCFLGRVFGNIHLYIFHISLGSFFFNLSQRAVCRGNPITISSLGLGRVWNISLLNSLFYKTFPLEEFFFQFFSHLQCPGKIQSLILAWEKFWGNFLFQFLGGSVKHFLGKSFWEWFPPSAQIRENPTTISSLGRVFGKFPFPIPGWVCKTFPWVEFLTFENGFQTPPSAQIGGKIQPLFLPWEEFLGNFPSQILGGSVNHILG